MRRLVLTMLLFGVIAAPALALPAPMSKEQLLTESDLVALVRIKSVTCVSVAKDERTGEALPSWTAEAELIEVIKGEDVKGDTVTITSTPSPPACSARGASIIIPARWCGPISSAKTANTPARGGTRAARW